MVMESKIYILNQKRKVFLFKILILVSLFVGFFLFVYMTVPMEEFVNVYLMNMPVFILIFIALMSLVAMNDIIKYKELYKKQVVEVVFNSIFTDVKYNPDEGIPKKSIKQTNMIYMGNKYSSNDYICAEYKGIHFEFSDVNMGFKYFNDYITIFHGQWFIFDFNKPFKADMQISSLSFFSDKHGTIFDDDKLQKVELENIEFNKKFNVFAKDELDVFYVLSPNFMEKLIELDKSIYGKLLFCFVDGKLHVGVYNNEDLFCPQSIFKKINLEKERDKILKEIKLITDFIDVLELDKNLFMR